ncbi:site-specific integrase [Nonomuraea sp. NPDC004580]|uniref:tyrosine-type recombinase/integrase n=1 Tax=Nonomuraea sp. NPDC004580 TaxID=3154552 RepID=UPI0033AD4669
MSGRKPNGRSSIYLSETDGLWHGWVTMGVKDDGSPDRRHRTGKTEAEVTRKVRDLESKRDAGKSDKPGRAPTVEQWMTTYLDDIAARDLAPTTLESYWSDTRNWIIKYLGKHRLDRLLPEHLDKLYTRMLNEGKKPSHVLKVHRILSRALEIAVRRDRVGRNVAKLVDPPGAGGEEIEPLTQGEARRILKAAETRRNGARWSVALALGLRQGEALGLRWKYVDLDGGTVRVWWQISRLKWRHGCGDVAACTEGKHRRPCAKRCAKARRKSGRPHVCIPANAERLCPKDCDRHASTCPERTGGGLVFRPPKGKSKRTVPLPPELLPILKAHRKRQREERIAAANVWEDHDLVFAQPNGRPIDPRDDWDDWKELLDVAGVRDARVHDGRHTAGTLLIEQGVHVRTVQEILGHSDIRLTQRYTHVASPMAADGMQRMGRALWGSGT